MTAAGPASGRAGQRTRIDRTALLHVIDSAGQDRVDLLQLLGGELQVPCTLPYLCEEPDRVALDLLERREVCRA